MTQVRGTSCFFGRLSLPQIYLLTILSGQRSISYVPVGNNGVGFQQEPSQTPGVRVTFLALHQRLPLQVSANCVPRTVPQLS
jgi:hypothetical protein